MERNKRKSFLLITLFIISLFISGLLYYTNKANRSDFAKEKSVLKSEKVMLNKLTNELYIEKRALNNKSVEQQSRINDLLNFIENKNTEIKSLVADNSNVQNLRKKIKELEILKDELRKELKNLKGNIETLSQNNSNLELEKQALTTENERLSSELMLSKSLKSNDFLIKGIKKNQKITAWACRSKVISLAFDFPEKYVNELEIIIYTPTGKTFTTANKDIVTLASSNEPASLYPLGLIAKRMEISIKPEKNFSKGIYKFAILKGSDLVSTMQFQLK